MNFNQLFFSVLEEQSLLKTTKTKPIVDAIKNRYPISFYYSGPRKPKKDSVKPGYRIKAESVALGLSRKGNLVLRAWVQPPSTSKKGFDKSGWRTFMLSRMNNVQVLQNETFDTKRPQYKEGNDNSMSVTYVTADWTKIPKTISVKKPISITEPTKQTEPSIEKPESKTTKLLQPKPVEKPSKEPNQSSEEPNQDTENKRKELYIKKQSEFIDKQTELDGNIKPGQGTRARFNKEVEKEIPQPKPEEKPSDTPVDNNDEDEEEDELLNENIKKIKYLMFF